MNTAHRWLVVPFAVLALSACGGGQEQAHEPPPVKDTVFGDAVGTMDKARGVETTTMEHKEELDNALDAAEGDH